MDVSNLRSKVTVQRVSLDGIAPVVDAPSASSSLGISNGETTQTALGDQALSIDLHDLADRVYRLLREDLLVGRERE